MRFCIHLILGLLSEAIFDFFAGPLSLAEEWCLLQNAGTRLLPMIFSFGLESVNASACWRLWVFLLLVDRAVDRTGGKVAMFLTQAGKYQAGQHQKLFFIQVVIILVIIYGMFAAYRTLGVVSFCHVLGGLMTSALSSLLDIFGHIVFLVDRDELGDSVGSHRVIFVGEAVVTILKLAVSLFFIGRLLVESECPVFLMSQLHGNLIEGAGHYEKLRAWMKMRYVIEHLPVADEEDVVREEICIICRMEMRVGTGRRLPCRHCFDSECIERWTRWQPICPVCKQDLKESLKEAERRLDEETQQVSVVPEDRSILRFADFVK
jgi:hypothetical protein